MMDAIARRECIGLLETAEAAYVTTLEADGFPCTRAMFNLRRKDQFPGLAEAFRGHDDDLLVYFSTNTSSEKVRQIRENPAVSVYYCRPGNFHGMMLSGRMEIVTDAEVKRALWQEGWETYYPAGPEDPDYAVLRLRPSRVRGWLYSRPFDEML